MEPLDLIDAAKAAPPTAVTVLSVAGIALSQWVYVATLAYLVLQAGFLLWKWYNAFQDRKHNEQSK